MSDATPPGERRVRITARGRLDETDLEISTELDVRRIKPFVAYLKARGFRSAVRFDRTAEGLPICPKHGVPMPEKNHQGDTWHSHKIKPESGPDLWCRGYPGPSSEGYDLP